MGCRGVTGCSIIRASLPFANIGVLRAGRAQPLYLLTPAGRFALRATAHRADASLRCAHGFAAPLRVALGLWPKCPQGTRFPSRLAGVWGRLPVAQSSRRALAAPTARFAPSQISAFCALAARSPCICSHLRVALRCAQQPTGLTLPSGAPSPVPQHKKASVASARRAQETRLAQPLPEYQRKRRGHPPPGGAAPPLFQKTLSLERPAFLASLRSLATLDGLCRRKRRRPPLLPASSRVSRSPSVARNARRALAPEALASSRVFLHQAAFLASLRSLATLDGLCRRKRRRPPLIPASSRVSCSLRSLATLTAFAAAQVFGALPQTPARA